MIALFTDFGVEGPYVGQMHAAIAALAPQVPVIDLFHDVPPYDVQAGAYLLASYTAGLPEGAVCVAVVDPGVGGPRRALMVEADARWFVGPDNGLFAILGRRARRWRCLELVWRPERLSASFHGRDLFAPAAARLARGEMPESRPAEPTPPPEDWGDDLARILYIDRYGNAITGIRAATLAPGSRVQVAGRVLRQARVFGDLPEGEAFWYENANGLVEIAVNRGQAARDLRLRVGDPVGVLVP
jgi:S-adenosylmethionine hydrolase